MQIIPRIESSRAYIAWERMNTAGFEKCAERYLREMDDSGNSQLKGLITNCALIAENKSEVRVFAAVFLTLIETVVDLLPRVRKETIDNVSCELNEEDGRKYIARFRSRIRMENPLLAKYMTERSHLIRQLGVVLYRCIEEELRHDPVRKTV
jgi:hypothetical protein